MAMSNLLFYEWKRLFKERNFRYILLALFVLCVGSAILSSLNYSFEEAAWSTLPKDDNGNLLQNVSLATYTLYNSWIGGLPTGLAPIIFYTMLPLCASIPYATTIIDDRKSGYIRGFIAQYGRKRYYLCRYLMVFISGTVTIQLRDIFLWREYLLAFGWQWLQQLLDGCVLAIMTFWVKSENYGC